MGLKVFVLGSILSFRKSNHKDEARLLECHADSRASILRMYGSMPVDSTSWVSGPVTYQT